MSSAEVRPSRSVREVLVRVCAILPKADDMLCAECDRHPHRTADRLDVIRWNAKISEVDEDCIDRAVTKSLAAPKPPNDATYA